MDTAAVHHTVHEVLAADPRDARTLIQFIEDVSLAVYRGFCDLDDNAVLLVNGYTLLNRETLATAEIVLSADHLWDADVPDIQIRVSDGGAPLEIRVTSGTGYKISLLTYTKQSGQQCTDFVVSDGDDTVLQALIDLAIETLA